MSDAVDVMRTLTMDQLRDVELIIFGDDKAKNEHQTDSLTFQERASCLLISTQRIFKPLSLQDFVDLKVETMKKLGFIEKEIK